MSLRAVRLAAVLVLVASLLAGGGCSRFTFWRGGDEYQRAGSVRSLEIPPDLTRPRWSERYTVPGEEVAGPRIRQGGTTPEGEMVVPVFEGVQVHRAGTLRWLEVDEPPERLWPRLRAFFKEQGIRLERDDPLTGILRTEWLEERASLPGFGLQGVINRVAGIFVGEVGIRNRFRLRVERSPSGGSTVYLSSQRAELIADPMEDDRQPQWGMVPPDPEAEAEFLTRLMVYLGYGEEEAREAVARAEPLPGPQMRLEETGDGVVLEIEAPLSEAWRTIGLALDRAGLYVEEQNPSRHVYYFVYTEEPGRKRSFWERLTGPRHGLRPERRYALRVTPQGGRLRLTVHPGGEDERPLKPEGQREVLRRLMEAYRLSQ